MGVQAKDGSYHHSAGRASLHNDMHSSRPPDKKLEGEHFKKPTEGNKKSGLSIEEHVKKHGPAHEAHYHHDKATDIHHVVTHHGDGGEGAHHYSEHQSAEDAHAHMGKAMGLGAGEAAEPAESPDMADNDMMAGSSSGGGNPFMNS